MILTAIICFVVIIAMVLSILYFPKIKIKNVSIDTYWVITLFGALLLMLLKKVDLTNYFESLTTTAPINPIKIIVLFFSMTFLSIFLDEMGFFNYVASYCINKANSSQFSIFTIFYFTISLLTIFTSNDIIILTFTPFICYFCKKTKINATPYLIGEFIAANTLSMALMIGNPTNIYLSLSSYFTFMGYFKVMFLRSILTCLLAYVLLLIIFRRNLKEKLIKEKTNCVLENKRSVIVGLVILISCTLSLALCSYISVEMYVVSLFFFALLLIYILIESIIKKDFKVIKNLFKRLPYPLIPFLLSMFAIVNALNECGIIYYFANLLKGDSSIFTIGYSSFIMCSFVNNIPMSVLYSNMFTAVSYDANSIYAAIIGSNIGALLTPVGALAGIMFINIVSKSQVEFKFKDFIKYSAPVSIILMSFMLMLLSI